MSRFTALVFATVFGAFVALPVFAAETPATPAAGLTDAQKVDVEKVVREVLEKNPEIIVNAAQAYQAKQAADADKKAAEAVVKYKDRLYGDAKDPFDGNAKGDIQIVEFFDYNCGFCKKVHEPLVELLKTEKDVKIIYKHFPILSDSSKTAAKAALAAGMQGKYSSVHTALLDHKGGLDDATVMDLAAKAGANTDKLKKDMEGPEVAAQLASSMQLANELGAHGTPTFIMDDKVVPGAMSLDEMKKIIADIREKKKKG